MKILINTQNVANLIRTVVAKFAYLGDENDGFDNENCEESRRTCET